MNLSIFIVNIFSFWQVALCCLSTRVTVNATRVQRYRGRREKNMRQTIGTIVARVLRVYASPYVWSLRRFDKYELMGNIMKRKL